MKIPSWLNSQKVEILEVLPKCDKDLGGPLSSSRFVKGIFLEQLGTINKMIKETEKAKKAFTEASLAYWPYDGRKPAAGWQEDKNKPEYIYEERAGYRQRKAAICAFLGGDREMANKIFEWASENLDIPLYALEFNKPGGQGEHITSGELVFCQAYVDARLGQFSAVKKKITDAKNIFDYFVRKKNKRIDMEYRYQCEILKELAEYKLHPIPENKTKAQNALLTYKMACPKNIHGLMNYLYIFDLQEAFPEVFEAVLP